MTETWLNDSHNISSLKIPTYHDPIYENRSGKKGGGVAFHVKDDLTFTRRYDLEMTAAETLFIEISLSTGKQLIIGVVYRTEANPVDDFINDLDFTLSKIEKEHKLAWLTGDFNIDLLKHGELAYVDNFINTLFSNSYYPLISKPTRVTKNTATLIDNIFSNDLQKVNSGILIPDISDHFAIFQPLAI